MMAELSPDALLALQVCTIGPISALHCFIYLFFFFPI